MEKNKQKNSFLKKWFGRLALVLGIGASSLLPGPSDAHAASLIDDRQDNTMKIEDKVEHSAIQSPNLKTDLEEQMAKDKQQKSFKGSQILSAEAPASSGETHKFSTSSEPEKTQTITFRTNSIEYPNTDKSEKTSKQDSVEQAQETTIADFEANAKKLLSNSKFKHLHYNPYIIETELSNQIVSLKQQIGEAKVNGNTELEKELVAKHNELLQQRSELSTAIENHVIIPKPLETSPKYQAMKNMSPEELHDLTSFVNESSDNWTSGNKSAIYSNKLVDLEVRINTYIQNNDPDNYNATDRENYYSTLTKLLETYNYAKEQNKIINQKARENPGDPEYNLELPNSNDNASTIEVDNNKTAEATKTGGLIDDTHEVEKDDNSEKTELEADTAEVTTEFKTGGLIDDTHEVEKDDNSNTNEYVDITEPTFKDTYIPSEYSSQTEKATFKTTSTKEYTIKPVTPPANPGTIDESKLNDVSVGQMGDFSYMDEDEPEPQKKPGEIDFNKVAEGIPQMGIWNEMEEVMDAEIAKQEASKTSKSSKNSKSKDDDELER